MIVPEPLAQRIAWNPNDADRILLAGTEASIETIAIILATLPASARGQVFIEVQSTTEIMRLAAPGRFGISWLVRDCGQSLGRSVEAWLSEMLPVSAVATSSVYAWIEAEGTARLINSA